MKARASINAPRFLIAVLAGWVSLSSIKAEPAIKILDKYCTDCHGEDLQEGDLRLDQEGFARTSSASGRPILSSKLEKSQLHSRITMEDPGRRMPPEDEPQLKDEEILILKSWLAAGAPWPRPEDYNAGETLVQKLRNRSSLILRKAVWLPGIFILLVIGLVIWVTQARRKGSSPKRWQLPPLPSLRRSVSVLLLADHPRGNQPSTEGA